VAWVSNSINRCCSAGWTLNMFISVTGLSVIAFFRSGEYQGYSYKDADHCFRPKFSAPLRTFTSAAASLNCT
jgi:hypothetical protein